MDNKRDDGKTNSVGSRLPPTDLTEKKIVNDL